MTTTTHTPQAPFIYYLLRDSLEQTGGCLPAFSDMLTATVHDLNRSGWTSSNFNGYLPAVDAWELIFTVTEAIHDRTHTTEAIRQLEPAVGELRAAHPATDCEWAEDCTVCPALTRLASLIAAYQRLHTETIVPADSTTGATA